jgi:hypothetical protein
MRFLKKQLSWWRIILTIGVAAMAIPIASRVNSTAKAVVKERQDYLDLQSTAANEDADNKDSKAKHSKDIKAAVGEGVAPPQDILYDRRSQYWDKRVLRRLEDLDEEEADDEDSKDSKDSKDKATKNSKDDDEGDVDDADQELERRREYWRKRLDRDW